MDIMCPILHGPGSHPNLNDPPNCVASPDGKNANNNMKLLGTGMVRRIQELRKALLSKHTWQSLRQAKSRGADGTRPRAPLWVVSSGPSKAIRPREAKSRVPPHIVDCDIRSESIGNSAAGLRQLLVHLQAPTCFRPAPAVGGTDSNGMACCTFREQVGLNRLHCRRGGTLVNESGLVTLPDAEDHDVVEP